LSKLRVNFEPYPAVVKACHPCRVRPQDAAR